MEKRWEELSAGEKQEAMFQKWLSPQGVKFTSPQAEKAYKQRVTRIKDAVQLKKPDTIPVCPMTGFFPAYYAGYTPKDVMYDYEKLAKAFEKYVLELKPDGHGGAMVAAPGRFFEILDYRLYAWPGHGVAPEVSYQCIEGEYMKADEYDILIQDPTFFFTSIYFPRIFGALEPLKKLPTLTNVLEIYGSFSALDFIPFGLPEVQNAYKAICIHIQCEFQYFRRY